MKEPRIEKQNKIKQKKYWNLACKKINLFINLAQSIRSQDK